MKENNVVAKESAFITRIGDDELENYVEQVFDGEFSFEKLRKANIIVGDYIRVEEMDRIVAALKKVILKRREQYQHAYAKSVASDLAQLRVMVEKLKHIVKTYCPQDALVEECFRCP